MFVFYYTELYKNIQKHVLSMSKLLPVFKIHNFLFYALYIEVSHKINTNLVRNILNVNLIVDFTKDILVLVIDLSAPILIVKMSEE